MQGIELTAPPLRNDTHPSTCSVDGCETPYFSKGWCKSHYNRVFENGEPGSADIREWGRTTCSVDGCNKKHLARGLCDQHYRMLPDRKAYDVVKSGRRRARQRKQSVEWPISAMKVQARIDYFGGRCWICGGEGADEIDHVKPLALGGLHIPANLRPAHGSCNRSKGADWEGVILSGRIT